MVSKQNKDKAQQQHSQSRLSKAGPAARRSWWWLALVVILVAMVVAAQFAVDTNQDSSLEESKVQNKPNIPIEAGTGDTAWDSSWPPLPQSGEPARPIEVVRAAYAYAVHRGDILQYMPCYCGCERQGHRSNHDCFVNDKTEAGIPLWDSMGYT